MKTLNTRKLSGLALSWAVALCELRRREAEGEHIKPWIKEWNAAGYVAKSERVDDWLVVGPIVEREEISLSHQVTPEGPRWAAELERLPAADDHARYGHAYGATPCEAAARCYVVSMLGETLDVPEVFE